MIASSIESTIVSEASVSFIQLSRACREARKASTIEVCSRECRAATCCRVVVAAAEEEEIAAGVHLAECECVLAGELSAQRLACLERSELLFTELVVFEIEGAGERRVGAHQ